MVALYNLRGRLSFRLAAESRPDRNAICTRSMMEQAGNTAETLQGRHIERESPLELFNSAEANALRAEIIRTGRKLWDRQYVDGNGGNLSVRLGAEFVLCTPT